MYYIQSKRTWVTAKISPSRQPNLRIVQISSNVSSPTSLVVVCRSNDISIIQENVIHLMNILSVDVQRVGVNDVDCVGLTITAARAVVPGDVVVKEHPDHAVIQEQVGGAGNVLEVRHAAQSVTRSTMAEVRIRRNEIVTPRLRSNVVSRTLPVGSLAIR